MSKPQHFELDLSHLVSTAPEGLAHTPVVQSGAVQFNDDEVGFFIRGHDAACYLRHLGAIRRIVAENYPGDILLAAVDGLIRNLSPSYTEHDSRV